MDNQPQRGRSVPPAKRPSPMRIFYILLAGIVVIGIALGGLFALQKPAAAPNTVAALGATLVAPSGPTGRTPDGFYYKGSADAKVVVTEYSDFQ